MKSIKLHKRHKSYKRNTKGTFKTNTKLRNTRKNKILKGGDPNYLHLYKLYQSDIIGYEIDKVIDIHEIYQLDRWWDSVIKGITDLKTISEKRKMILDKLGEKKKKLETTLKQLDKPYLSSTKNGPMRRQQIAILCEKELNVINIKIEKENAKLIKNRTIPTQLPNNYESQIKNETLKKLLKITLKNPKHSEAENKKTFKKIFKKIFNKPKHSEDLYNNFIECNFSEDNWEVLNNNNTLTYYYDDYELFKVIISDGNKFEVPDNIDEILKQIFNIKKLNEMYEQIILHNSTV